MVLNTKLNQISLKNITALKKKERKVIVNKLNKINQELI